MSDHEQLAAAFEQLLNEYLDAADDDPVDTGDLAENLAHCAMQVMYPPATRQDELSEGAGTYSPGAFIPTTYARPPLPPRARGYEA